MKIGLCPSSFPSSPNLFILLSINMHCTLSLMPRVHCRWIQRLRYHMYSSLTSYALVIITVKLLTAVAVLKGPQHPHTQLTRTQLSINGKGETKRSRMKMIGISK